MDDGPELWIVAHANAQMKLLRDGVRCAWLGLGAFGQTRSDEVARLCDDLAANYSLQHHDFPGRLLPDGTYEPHPLREGVARYSGHMYYNATTVEIQGLQEDLHLVVEEGWGDHSEEMGRLLGYGECVSKGNYTVHAGFTWRYRDPGDKPPVHPIDRDLEDALAEIREGKEAIAQARQYARQARKSDPEYRKRTHWRTTTKNIDLFKYAVTDLNVDQTRYYVSLLAQLKSSLSELGHRGVIPGHVVPYIKIV